MHLGCLKQCMAPSEALDNYLFKYVVVTPYTMNLFFQAIYIHKFFQATGIDAFIFIKITFVFIRFSFVQYSVPVNPSIFCPILNMWLDFCHYLMISRAELWRRKSFEWVIFYLLKQFFLLYYYRHWMFILFLSYAIIFFLEKIRLNSLHTKHRKPLRFLCCLHAFLIFSLVMCSFDFHSALSVRDGL